MAQTIQFSAISISDSTSISNTIGLEVGDGNIEVNDNDITGVDTVLLDVVGGNSSSFVDFDLNGETINGGDWHVDGTLSKNSGSFKIDHPLDPKNKFLYHSFIESPEMRNVYYGQSQTEKGKSVIEMPEWWHALNGKDKSEFTYHLTPIGKNANLWISKEMEDGQFEVSSDVDCKFSWQVTAIRHDESAEQKRIPVESYKNHEVIKKNPDMEMVSDNFEYDKETDTIYKKSEKELFDMQKPIIKEINKKRKELKKIDDEEKPMRDEVRNGKVDKSKQQEYKSRFDEIVKEKENLSEEIKQKKNQIQEQRKKFFRDSKKQEQDKVEKENAK